MSKTEIAMGSSASAPSQLIKQIRALQQQIQESQREIEQLPPAIAQQVSEALAPLEGLSLDKIERLAQVQRTTLDTMSSELTKQATASFEKSTRQLVTTINETAQQLESSTASLEATATAAATLPAAVNELQEQVQAIQDMRPRWWEVPVLAFSSAIIGASLVVVLVVTGIIDLSGPVPQGQEQMRRLLENATAQETELLKEIYERREQ